MIKRKLKIWSISKLSNNINKRQHNKYDVNIAVSGATGSGKSTFVAKLLFRFDNFKPEKHMVYDRQSVIDLIQKQKFGIVWDDEAIGSSYKRQFQNQGQQQLIKTVAMYRSNSNLYIAVLPEFFSLDKDLRDYYAIHIFIIKRGLAVMMRRDSRSMYATDRWHTTYNEKLEKSWQGKIAKNPNFKIPYHKLKGFVCYIKYNDITELQRELIERIKEEKRAVVMENSEQKVEPFIDKVLRRLLDGKITKEGLQQICLLEDKKYSSVTVNLNRILKDRGENRTLKDFFSENEDSAVEESKSQVLSLVPDV